MPTPHAPPVRARRFAAALALALTSTALLGGHALAQEAPGQAELPNKLQDAERRADPPRARAVLVSERDGLVPGEPATLAVKVAMDKGWHVYWHHPGDAGLPTQVTLGAPDGYQVGDLRYPAPKRFESTAETVSYGYDTPTLFLLDVQVPAGAREGESVTFNGRADWLVCKENCIPGGEALTLTLPVHSEAAPTEHAEAIATARKRVPLPTLDTIIAEVTTSADALRPGDPFEVVYEISELRDGDIRDAKVYPAPGRGLSVREVVADADDDDAPAGGVLVRISGEVSQDPDKKGDRLEAVLDAVLVDGDTRTPVLTELELVRFERRPAGAPVTVSDSDLIEHKPQGATAAADAKGDTKALVADIPTPARGERRPADYVPDPVEEPGAAEATLAQGEAPPAEEYSLGLMFLFALIGGIILNVMPCVLPVLSIKVLGLVQQSEEDPKGIWYHGVAYTVGVLVSFGVLAGIIIGLKSAGKAVGWGFQFQEPAFVAVLAAIVFAFALSLFGVFEVTAPGQHKLGAATSGKHGYSGSFINGIFATVLATPCTAPFLAPAMGFALSQSSLVLTLLLLTAGFGLALPFLLVAAFPRWARFLPKPGGWMTTFKQAMAFLLIGTTVWLLDVLSFQLSRGAMVGFIAFLATLGLALWVYGHWGSPIRAARTRWASLVVAVALASAGGSVFLSMERPAAAGGSGMVTETVQADDGSVPVLTADGDINWRDFSKTDVKALAAEGHTVFIDFTAAWCVTCKAYEATVIDTDEVKRELDAMKIAVVKADWTNEDEAITEWLQRHNRAGVPMYLILPAGKPEDAILLPDVLTTDALLTGLKQAGPSKPGPLSQAPAGGDPIARR